MSGRVISGSVEIPGRHAIDVPEILLARGTATFLRGPSGCGKTSIFRRICGADPYGGALSIAPVIAELAFVMHETTLIPWLSIVENLELEARMREIATPLDTFRECLAEMGVRSDMGVRAGTLSMGMRQRVEIARALSFVPEVVLLDEAWSGIDSTTRLTVFRLLNKFLKRDGVTILATTHADIDVLRFADQLYCFDGPAVTPNPVVCHLERSARLDVATAVLWQEPELADMVSALGSR